jgi:Tfp pilus assembly protein PilF
MVREGVHADARRELLAAIRADPDEAALHQLLGHVYERTGLDQLASHEFDEAERLAGR